MLRAWSGWVAVCSLVVGSAWASAQDSGPGPSEGSGSQQYEVTVLKLGSVTTGAFDFAVEMETEEPATATFTTGTFTATVNDAVSTGTWFAIDVGNSALWFATAEGTGGTQTITGIATPDFVAGRIVTQSTTSPGRFRFLRALFNTSVFFGTAVEIETEPPTDPMTETLTAN